VPSAEKQAKQGMSASGWLLIGGVSLGILGIVALLRRRRREENISIVDHSTPPRSGPTGATITHHP
jgi:LPXTG-motif cell wall-anchored protein